MSGGLYQAKRTEYKGTIYRSRLEVRWVTFFEKLGITHKYEPELIDLGLKNPNWTKEDETLLRLDLAEAGMSSASKVQHIVDFQKDARLQYRPDFWLPGFMHWFEVKGLQPTVEEIRKARLLAYRFGHPVNILYGSIPETAEEMAQHNLVYQSDVTITELLVIRYGESAITRALTSARQVCFEYEVSHG